MWLLKFKWKLSEVKNSGSPSLKTYSMCPVASHGKWLPRRMGQRQNITENSLGRCYSRAKCETAVMCGRHGAGSAGRGKQEGVLGVACLGLPCIFSMAGARCGILALQGSVFSKVHFQQCREMNPACPARRSDGMWIRAP